MDGNSAVAVETGTAGGPTSPYYTVGEAGGYLRRTRQGVYALVKRGRLHPMPGSPGRLLFTREELDRFLRTRPSRRRAAAAGGHTKNESAQPAGVAQ